MAERTSVTRCLAILGSAVVVAGVLFVGVILAVTLFSSEADKSNQSPSTGDTPLRLVAVGDGYTSGEGAAAFFPGTDRPGRNQCRRTSSSFPFLLPATLDLPDEYDGVALTSVACAGARTTHVIPFDDLECRDDWFPDGCPEPQYVRRPDGRFDPAFQVELVPADADVIVVSIGAGDAQLADIISLCAYGDEACGPIVEPWLETLDETLAWRLRRVYRELHSRAPQAEIVTFTYPSLLFPEACGSTRLDQDETEFLNDGLLPRLNDIITSAAADEAVHVVDLFEIFTGHRLCQPDRPDGDRPQLAVNGFQMKPIRGLTWKLSTWLHGSFYPNEYGHELVAERLSRALGPLLRTETPALSPSGDELPEPAFAAGRPEIRQIATGSMCGDPMAESRVTARPIRAELELQDADAATTVCYRSVSGPWRSFAVGSTGTATVPLEAHDTDGFAGWHEILYRSDGSWVRLFVVSPAGDNAHTLTLAKAWLWPWLVALGEIVTHPVIYVTLILMVLGGSLMWCTRRKREAGS